MDGGAAVSRDGESLGGKITWLVVSLVLTPPLMLIGSKIASGDWLTWMKAIPSWGFWAFFLVLLPFIVGLLIYRRVARLRERNRPHLPGIISVPVGGYVTIGTLQHNGVRWRVLNPAPDRWTRERSGRIEIDTPPRCLECDAELEEAERFFGGYRWSCIRCPFSVKNDLSFHHEAIRAESHARSEIEHPRPSGDGEPRGTARGLPPRSNRRGR